MTICVAALFDATYPDRTTGRVALVATDRMVPTGDIRHGGDSTRAGLVGRRALVLPAGDLAAHSEALSLTQRDLLGRPEIGIGEIAAIYAAHIRKLRMRQAVQSYLAPLGLDEQSFVHGQKDMAPALVSSIAAQIQNHKVRIEATVVGAEAGAAQLFHVDGEGIVSCRNEIGFLSIGHGAVHAESHFASSRYVGQSGLYDALLVAYVAKKKAEEAAGVAAETDLLLITREGVEPIFPEMVSVLQEIYEAKIAARRTIDQAGVMRLTECHRKFVQSAFPNRTPRAAPAMRVSGNFQTTLPGDFKHYT